MGFGGPVGLDYTGVRATADLAGLDLTPEVFAGLQAAERAWLEVIGEQSRKT